MFPVGQTLSKSQERLLKLYRRLNDTDKAGLVAFAEFLAARGEQAVDAEPSEILEPVDIPRPREESVIGAIKRLSKSYPMLDNGKMLNETSTLMSGHLLQGRAAAEVIDDLETLFRTHYADYRGE